MKFPALPASVHALRQSRKQRSIELAPHERTVELFRVDASQLSARATSDHLLSQSARRQSPHRKHRLQPRIFHLFLPVSAHILEKQISKRHSLDPLRHGPSASLSHQRLILFIRARPGQRHGPKRQPSCSRLPLHQLVPNSVHCNPVRLFVESSKQSNHVMLPALPKHMQTPGAVLTAAPRQKNAHDVCPTHRRCHPERSEGSWFPPVAPISHSTPAPAPESKAPQPPPYLSRA